MLNKDEELRSVKSYPGGHLYVIARKAYERTIDGKSDREPGKDDALISVVFAASSLEAFINELADIANQKTSWPTPENIHLFAKMMSEVENSRGSIRLKYMLARFIFSGKHYEKGEPPFQDFNNLFIVRDALVHLRPEAEFKISSDVGFIRVREPKVLSVLPKNILAKYDKKIVADWKSMISTQAVAKWACNTAAGMVHSILDAIPECHFKEIAFFCYDDTFQPII